MLIRLMLVILLGFSMGAIPAAALAAARDGSDGPRFAGEPAACPASASREVAILPYGGDGGFGNCATVITVMNLDKNPATAKCQFFIGGNANQAGSDATLTLDPGDSLNCATRSPDPLGVYDINANAGTGPYEGSARVCATTKKVAIEASLICNSASATAMKDLKVVFKKQKGD